MPELPEVETTRRGIAPALEGARINRLVVRERRLRWPVPRALEAKLAGQPVESLTRRGKYLILKTPAGSALIHLGMSGSMSIVAESAQPGKHDHFDIVSNSGDTVRFNDPRRFGSLLWAGKNPDKHPLLADLGPEPLGLDFTADYLYDTARHRRIAIKQHVMNSKVVVGVGNIYANEALHLSGIHPLRAAGRISKPRMAGLVDAIRGVLEKAIKVGGTTLRDYRGGDGKPGYFRQQLTVYERQAQPCLNCATPITRTVLGQRATYYCKQCQR